MQVGIACNYLISLVARGGIEPPTRGFSVLVFSRLLQSIGVDIINVYAGYMRFAAISIHPAVDICLTKYGKYGYTGAT
jgi:hypothetical protein